MAARHRLVVAGAASALLMAGVAAAHAQSTTAISHGPRGGRAIQPTQACPNTYTRLVQVNSTISLTLALTTAQPGDVIKLANGTYDGNFVDSTPGTAARPITICGTHQAVLDGDRDAVGYVLYLNRAPYTVVEGLTITNGQKGVMLDGSSHSVLDSLQVHAIGDEGIHLRRGTSDTVLTNSTIRDTGLANPQFGEGVYIGSAKNNWCVYTLCQPDRSDHNVISNNVIGPGVGAEDIDIKEGTTGGLVTGNTLNGRGMTGGRSWIDVKGSSWTISNNMGRHTPQDGFTVSLAVPGWGNNNTFVRNDANVRASGYGFYIQSGTTGNRVAPNNVVVRAGDGYSNIKPAPR